MSPRAQAASRRTLASLSLRAALRAWTGIGVRGFPRPRGRHRVAHRRDRLARDDPRGTGEARSRMAESSHKQIVITGATRGLGRALAEGFARLGHTVIGCGRDAGAIGALGAAEARRR